jgi:peptidoglycan/LPS O-acetylase OafA/YrhL
MRKEQLDGLRLIAFLMVFFYHVGAWHPSRRFDYGQFGTDLFFALSGFLITRMLLLNSGRSLIEEIKTFYIRRTLRIFPLYYSYLTVLLLLHKLTHPFWCYFYAFNIGFHLYHWKNALGHLWTLSVEEQYYLVYPILLLFTPAKWRLLLIIGLLLGFEYYNWKLWPIDGLWYLLTPTRTALMWGSLAGFVDVKFAERRIKGGLLFGIGTAISLFFLAVTLGKIHLPWSIWVAYYPFQPMAFALMVWGLWRTESRLLLTLFTLAPVVYLGRISYGLYLFHASSFWLVRIIPGGERVDPALLVFSLSLLQAMLSWHFLEKPINELKDKFKFTSDAAKADQPVAPIPGE